VVYSHSGDKRVTATWEADDADIADSSARTFDQSAASVEQHHICTASESLLVFFLHSYEVTVTHRCSSL
jgi:hypothetical protein